LWKSKGGRPRKKKGKSKGRRLRFPSRSISATSSRLARLHFFPSSNTASASQSPSAAAPPFCRSPEGRGRPRPGSRTREEDGEQGRGREGVAEEYLRRRRGELEQLVLPSVVASRSGNCKEITGLARTNKGWQFQQLRGFTPTSELCTRQYPAHD
jgi:hypothetical protein